MKSGGWRPDCERPLGAGSDWGVDGTEIDGDRG
jgi:hypothetical protein